MNATKNLWVCIMSHLAYNPDVVKKFEDLELLIGDEALNACEAKMANELQVYDATLPIEAKNGLYNGAPKLYHGDRIALLKYKGWPIIILARNGHKVFCNDINLDVLDVLKKDINLLSLIEFNEAYSRLPHEWRNTFMRKINSNKYYKHMLHIFMRNYSRFNCVSTFKIDVFDQLLSTCEPRQLILELSEIERCKDNAIKGTNEDSPLDRLEWSKAIDLGSDKLSIPYLMGIIMDLYLKDSDIVNTTFVDANIRIVGIKFVIDTLKLTNSSNISQECCDLINYFNLMVPVSERIMFNASTNMNNQYICRKIFMGLPNGRYLTSIHITNPQNVNSINYECQAAIIVPQTYYGSDIATSIFVDETIREYAIYDVLKRLVNDIIHKDPCNASQINIMFDKFNIKKQHDDANQISIKKQIDNVSTMACLDRDSNAN